MEKSLWLKDIRLKLDLTQEQVAERQVFRERFIRRLKQEVKNLLLKQQKR